MAQIVKSSKLQDGCELDVRYTFYFSNSEFGALFRLIHLVFSLDDDDTIVNLKSSLTEFDQRSLVHLRWSMERS